MDQSPKRINLKPEEAEFIEFMRDLNFGTIQELTVQHGLPQHCKVALRSVKFGGKK